MNLPQFTNVTESFSVVLKLAEQEAARRHSIYLDVEHLALGLLTHQSGIARTVFTSFSVDTHAVYDDIAAQVGMERPQLAELKGISRWAQTVLQRATDEANALGHSEVSDGHILLALLCERDGIVHDAFARTPLTEYGVRTALRERLPASASGSSSPTGPGRPLLGGRRPTEDKRPKRRGRPVIIVDPSQPRSQSINQTLGVSNRTLIIGVIAVIAAALVAYLPFATVFTVVFVFVGWIFSVTLHEFGHALVAYWGGDYTVKDKGYLSFNPLKYAHPTLSIYMPLIFLLLGGIGLPGGAVYIERHRLKNEWWGAAVSAAGPAANLLFAIVLALPFLTGLVNVDVITGNLWYSLNSDYLHDTYPSQADDQLRSRFGIEEEKTIWDNEVLWSAVALLAMLQITAVFFNLLPIPPLDGSGILEPFLDPQTRFQYLQIGRYGLMIVFFVFWFVDPINHAFWQLIFNVTDALGIPATVANTALIQRFLFWRN